MPKHSPKSKYKKIAADLFAKTTGIYGTQMNSEVGNAIEVLASQIEITSDLLKKGAKLTPRQLNLLLVDKTLSLADLSYNQYVKCGGALTSLARSASFTSTAVASGPLAVLPAVFLLADMYMTAKDCAPVVNQIYDNISGEIEKEVNKYDWSDDGIRYWIYSYRFL